MRKSTSLILIILAFLLSACSDTSSSEDKVYQFDLNDSQSPTHIVATQATEPWAEMVEEKTDGRVIINTHHSSELGDADSVWGDVKGGVYDIGAANVPYFEDSDLYPLTIGILPLAFPDNVTASKVLEKFKNKYMEDAFDDAKWMGMGVTDGFRIFGTSPLESVSDLKNKKIFVSGSVYQLLAKEWGATPVSFSHDELYTALQRDTIDQAFFNTVGAAPRKLDEVAPYMTSLDFTYIPFVLIINNNSFDELPDDLKEIMSEELLPKLAEMQNETYYEAAKEEEENFKDLVGDKGGITDIDKEDPKVTEAVNKAWENWIEEANEKGYPGDEMVNDLIEFNKEEGYEVPVEINK